MDPVDPSETSRPARAERAVRLFGLAVVASLFAILVVRPIERAAVQSAFTAALLVVVAIAILLPWLAASKLARFVARLLLAFLAVIATALVIDAALHHYPPADPYRIEPVPNSAASELLINQVQPKWRQAPHFSGVTRHPQFPGIPYVTNGDGYRDSEWQTDHPAGQRRVLVLGDSLTVGLGVAEPDCWPRRVEALLAKARPATPVRVFNGAVSGYGPGEEIFVAKELYPRLMPTDIVVTFYDGNDLDDLRDFLRRVPPYGGANSPFAGVLGRSAGGDTALESRVDEHFDSAGLLDLDYWKASSALGRFLDAHVGDALFNLGVASSRPVWNLGLLRGMARDPADAQLNQEIDLCVSSFTELAKSCAGVSVKLWLVRIPARIQVVGEEFDALAKELKLDAIKIDRTEPGRTILERSGAGGVTSIDTFAALGAAGAASCYHREGHLNAKGCGVVAETVAKALAGQP